METLATNWRSDRRVVEFNNALFSQLSTLMANELEQQLSIDASDIRQAYEQVEQTPASQEDRGFVQVEFIPDGEENGASYSSQTLAALLHTVEKWQQEGVPGEQMAILVRKTKFIPLIASWFATYKDPEKEANGICYDLISDEAFQLSASGTIQILTGAMKYLLNPANSLLAYQLELDYQEMVCHRTDWLTDSLSSEVSGSSDCPLLPTAFTDHLEELAHLPLYELAETIYHYFNLAAISGEDDYLHAFWTA
jgi:hypothetical protein